MGSFITFLFCISAVILLGAAESNQHTREEHIFKDKVRREAALKLREEEYHKELHFRREKLVKSLRESRPSVKDKPTDPRDLAAIQALYQSTNGPKWFNNSGWMQGDACTYPFWFGLYCIEGRVVDINLDYNGLDGDLPSDLSQATALQIITMYSNGLTGDIPHGLFTIQSMQVIDLNSNSITGSLPAIISMANLTHLALYGNKIKSVFPRSLDAPKLQVLDVSDNMITDYLPQDLSSSVNLTDLIVSRNQLRGTFPSSYSKLVGLKNFWTFYNNFEFPSLPDGFQAMTQLVNVQMDSLSGPLPAWIGTRWTKVQYLIMINGELSGSIPESICNLQGVIGLRVFNNSLTGKLPDCICNMKNMTDFEVSDNMLSGSIPDNFENCKVLENYYVSRNNLTGTFPSSAGKMPRLEVLDISSNGLYGTIPNTINSLKDTIAEFAICFNMFSDVESDLTPFFKRIVDYSCLFYNNPWSCPLAQTVPKECSVTCSPCNAGKKHESCSACVASSECGWCEMGNNCLDTSTSGPEGYKCPLNKWQYKHC